MAKYKQIDEILQRLSAYDYSTVANEIPFKSVDDNLLQLLNSTALAELVALDKLFVLSSYTHDYIRQNTINIDYIEAYNPTSPSFFAQETLERIHDAIFLSASGTPTISYDTAEDALQLSFVDSFVYYDADSTDSIVLSVMYSMQLLYDYAGWMFNTGTGSFIKIIIKVNDNTVNLHEISYNDSFTTSAGNSIVLLDLIQNHSAVFAIGQLCSVDKSILYSNKINKVEVVVYLYDVVDTTNNWVSSGVDDYVTVYSDGSIAGDINAYSGLVTYTDNHYVTASVHRTNATITSTFVGFSTPTAATTQVTGIEKSDNSILEHSYRSVAVNAGTRASLVNSSPSSYPAAVGSQYFDDATIVQQVAEYGVQMAIIGELISTSNDAFIFEFVPVYDAANSIYYLVEGYIAANAAVPVDGYTYTASVSGSLTTTVEHSRDAWLNHVYNKTAFTGRTTNIDFRSALYYDTEVNNYKPIQASNIISLVAHLSSSYTNGVSVYTSALIPEQTALYNMSTSTYTVVDALSTYSGGMLIPNSIDRIIVSVSGATLTLTIDKMYAFDISTQQIVESIDFNTLPLTPLVYTFNTGIPVADNSISDTYVGVYNE